MIQVTVESWYSFFKLNIICVHSLSPCAGCGTTTLPALSEEVAKIAYCSLSENCLRLDCCLELNIEKFKFRHSFKAFVEVDACDFTITIAFQNLRFPKMLLSYEWGECF